MIEDEPDTADAFWCQLRLSEDEVWERALKARPRTHRVRYSGIHVDHWEFDSDTPGCEGVEPEYEATADALSAHVLKALRAFREHGAVARFERDLVGGEFVLRRDVTAARFQQALGRLIRAEARHQAACLWAAAPPEARSSYTHQVRSRSDSVDQCALDLSVLFSTGKRKSATTVVLRPAPVLVPHPEQPVPAEVSRFARHSIKVRELCRRYTEAAELLDDAATAGHRWADREAIKRISKLVGLPPNEAEHPDLHQAHKSLRMLCDWHTERLDEEEKAEALKQSVHKPCVLREPTERADFHKWHGIPLQLATTLVYGGLENPICIVVCGGLHSITYKPRNGKYEPA